MNDLPLQYFKNIKKENGIWFPDTKSKISYPADGNATLFEVEAESFWFKHRNKMILNLIESNKPKGPIIDIGGGNGIVSNYLQQHGFNCILLEPGIVGVENAKKWGLKHLICGTTNDLNIIPESIPAIGLFDVLEHIKNDLAFLQNIHSTLTPNGLLYFTVPALQLLFSHEDVVAGHYRRYKIKTIRTLFKKSGYSLIYCSYFFSALALPIFLNRTIPYRVWNRKKGGLGNQKKDLSSGKGHITKFLNYLWRLENNTLKKRINIPFGSSIIGVARKKNS